MATRKKTKEVKKQSKSDDFLSLVKTLKEIVMDHNQRLSEVEALINKIKQRLGL
jgi:hypothetical protein